MSKLIHTPHGEFTIEALEEFLLDQADKYYNNGISDIQDDDYDKMARQYEMVSGKKLPVGAAVKIGTTLDLDHSYSDFAGTLSKCQSMDDLREWLRKKKVNPNKLYCSLKFDGYSITVETVVSAGRNVIHKALTRGKDGKGKDLTALFKANVKHIPLIDTGFDYAIGYEAVLQFSNFDELNKEVETPYKNPRNAMAGVFTTENAHLFKYVTLVPLRMKGKDVVLSREEEIQYINSIQNLAYEEIHEEVTIDDIEESYNYLTEARFDRKVLDVMCDGLVIESAIQADRNKLGYTNNEPNFATALKFPAIEREVIVTNMDWPCEGFTATFTPRVWFTPIKIFGNTYQKVSLANYARFNELGLKQGDRIKFKLSNDVLGYVELYDDHEKRNKDAVGLYKKYEAPNFCHKCGEELYTDENEVFLFCDNKKCPLNQVGSILKFIKGTEGKFIDLETIRKMVEANLVSNVGDLFTFNYNELPKIEGCGTSTLTKFKTWFCDLKENGTSDYQILGSLNIDLISKGRALTILREYTMDEIIDLYQNKKLNELTKIEKVGTETINALKKGLTENFDDIKFLFSGNPIKVIQTKQERAADFKALKFCTTGSSDPFTTRDDLKKFLIEKGHSLVGKVTAKTDYLVTNDTTSGTGKNRDAANLGVKIISVQEMIDLLK
jgi:DNA ligase (NAD+)